jgi:hypothetical protein
MDRGRSQTENSAVETPMANIPPPTIHKLSYRFEMLGFEQADEDCYKVYFRDVELGEFDADALRFRPV